MECNLKMTKKDKYKFKLEDGDYLEGIFCEIYITQNSHFVFHCKLCESTFANYAWLLEHLIDEHQCCEESNKDCNKIAKYQINTHDRYECCCAVIKITHRSAVSYNCSMCADIYNEFWALLEHLMQDHFSNTSSAKNGIRQHVRSKVNKKIRLAIKEYNERRSIDDDASGSEEKGEVKKNDVLPNMLVDVELPSDSESDIEKAIQEGAHQGDFYICKTCEGKKFSTLGRFRYHMKQHRTKRKFVCPHCDKAFKHANTCKAHIRRHVMPKLLKCKQCPQTFLYKGERAVHERYHNDELSCICTICGRGFKLAKLLKKHMRRHNDERPYSCNICEKSFYENHYLKRHMTMHSEDRPHACTQCDAKFKTRKTLSQHRKLHSNERAYACNMCDSSFNQYTALYCHLRNRHKIVDPKSFTTNKKCLNQEELKCTAESGELHA